MKLISTAIRIVGALVLGLGLLDSAAAETHLMLHSEAGDYIGQGAEYVFLDDEAVFSAQGNYAGDPATGVRVTVRISGSEYWNLSFADRDAVALDPGSYAGATRFPFSRGQTHGLSVSGMGRGCNTLTGTFRILQIEYGADNSIVRFAADFEQHCEGATAALRGQIRFNYEDACGGTDSDGDGVAENADSCSNSAAGAAVDGQGCSLEQFCRTIVSYGTCWWADWSNDAEGPYAYPADCRWDYGRHTCLAY